MPESTERCSNRSEPIGGRGDRTLRFADEVVGRGRAGRFEQREPHVFVVLEADGDLLADVNVVVLAADDVRGEVHGRVFGERDVCDRVRRFEAGEPLVLVDGEPDDRAAAADFGRRPGPAAAGGADRNGWVHQFSAVVAALDPQAAVGAGRPEPFVHRHELGKRSHHFQPPIEPIVS